MSKYLACDDLGCDYMLVDDVLHFRPHGNIQEEFYPVEPDLVGEEVVTFRGKDVTLYQVYDWATKELKELNETLVS